MVSLCWPLILCSVSASNLKKIVERVFDYCVDVLSMDLNDVVRPDVMKIAEKSDRNELGRLLQLILGKFSAHFALRLHSILMRRHSQVAQ